MEVFTSADIEQKWNRAVSMMRPDHLALAWHIKESDVGYLRNREVKENMYNWRQEAKRGEMKIQEENHNTITDKNGMKWYVLITQYIDPNTKTYSSWNDPVYLFIHGMMVNGIAYYFREKVNRDMVYEYVMKDI